jgi:hypothetical protein
MTVFQTTAGRATAHANAMVRLCSAREALWGAENRHARVRGTPGEVAALHRLGEATAELATREQWLHWVEHGTTIRPAADGEWGVAPETEDRPGKRAVEPRTVRLRASGHRAPPLRSVR